MEPVGSGDIAADPPDERGESGAGARWWAADNRRREGMLREFWPQRDISTAMIARLIGDGATKNNVISKAHRMGLGARDPEYRPPAPPRPRDPFAGLAPDGCRWPLGNPGDPDFHFCGSPQIAAKPYCDRHAAVAYIKTGGASWTPEQREAASKRAVLMNARRRQAAE